MTEQIERLMDLVQKAAKKRYDGNGQYPYATIEYNGEWHLLSVCTAPHVWRFFTEERCLSWMSGKYKPLSEGIKLLEELTS